MDGRALARFGGALLALCAVAGAVFFGPEAAAQNCPPLKNGAVTFPDASIAMSTGLAVNPDGAAASYAPGDRGYTYLNNGVNLIDDGKKVSCSAKGNGGRCRRDWATAEAGAFGKGTPQFCVFAMEVEPVAAGAKKVLCEDPKKKRYAVGDGKGRPVSGAPIATVSGGSVAPYVSTTTLTHTKGGRVVYVDSAALPGLVVPTTRGELVGAVAWVRLGSRETFAIVNDTGPAFGEGSVALHQALRNGQIGPLQPIGPISVADRCGPAETGLRAPFLSRPDGGDADRCRAGYKAKTASDIRAYSGVGTGVTSIILPSVRPPMNGRTATVELTPALLKTLAEKAGYTAQKLAQMAACVAH